MTPLFLFENNLACVRRVETGRHSGIPRFITGNGERAVLYLVYGVTHLAHIFGLRTVGDFDQKLLRSCVFANGESALIPLVGIGPAKIEI